jgi:hypothetical protein
MAGKVSLNIDISTFPAATYFVSVILEDGMLQQKFVKH